VVKLLKFNHEGIRRRHEGARRNNNKLKVMKTIALVFLMLPLTILAQWCPNANDLGTLSAEVYGNSVILKNDTVCRNCGSMYEMVIYPIAGDTLGWYQDEQFGGAFCDCIFDLSVTLDSLNPGNYYVKTSYESVYTADTVYIGLISFTITEQNSFDSYGVTDAYQSECYTVGINSQDQPENNLLTVIPNPSNDKITISAPATTGNSQLSIFNISGKYVIEMQLTNTETQIDISALPRGVYFVRVQNEKMVEVGKMVTE
jgi:hypothetical protein